MSDMPDKIIVTPDHDKYVVYIEDYAEGEAYVKKSITDELAELLQEFIDYGYEYGKAVSALKRYREVV